MCVTFFIGPTGSKAAVMPNPFMEEEIHVYNFDNEHLSGINK